MAHPFEPTGRRFVGTPESMPDPAAPGKSMLSEIAALAPALYPEGYNNGHMQAPAFRPDMASPGSFTNLAHLAESVAGYDDDGRVVNISRGTRQVRAVADAMRPFLGVVTGGEAADEVSAPRLPRGAFDLIIFDESHRVEPLRYQGLRHSQGGQSNFRLASLDARHEQGPDCE